VNFSFDVASVLAAIILAAGGMWAFRSQKHVDQAHELNTMKREFYPSYIDALHSASVGNPEPYRLAIAKGAVLASDEVLKAMSKVRQLSSRSDKQGVDEFNRSLGEVLVSMRKDVFDRTAISSEEFVQLLPIRKDQ